MGGDSNKNDTDTQTETSMTTMTASTTAAVHPPLSLSKPITTTTNNTCNTKRTFVRRTRRIRRRNADQNQIPALDDLLLQKVLNESGLPVAVYSFEIPKTVMRIVELQAQHVALQMPEGLLLYATVLADVLQRLSQNLNAVYHQQKQHQEEQLKDTREPLEQKETTTTTTNDVIVRVCRQVSVLGDVTYGACCIGDLDAQALGADLLVHYGHSCLVPLQHTVVPCLYVFVEIQMDVLHMVQSLHATLQHSKQQQEQQQHRPKESAENIKKDKVSVVIYLLATIQFRHALETAKSLLVEQGYDSVYIPQVKPLSPGEVLGCTSPKLDLHCRDSESSSGSADNTLAVCCFVADGRFHLESTMISNPYTIDTYYRYDPYSKTLTTESYAHEDMKAIRYEAITQTQHLLQRAAAAEAVTTTGTDQAVVTFGILLGTLGRQGNPAIVQRIREALKKYNESAQHKVNNNKNNNNHKKICRSFVMLLSEITPAKLALLDKQVQVWIQVACPRLSVDWGHFLAQNKKPVLSPYEFFCALDPSNWQTVYPMDFYAQTGGPWANYHADNKTREILNEI